MDYYKTWVRLASQYQKANPFGIFYYSTPHNLFYHLNTKYYAIHGHCLLEAPDYSLNNVQSVTSISFDAHISAGNILFECDLIPDRPLYVIVWLSEPINAGRFAPSKMKYNSFMPYIQGHSYNLYNNWLRFNKGYYKSGWKIIIEVCLVDPVTGFQGGKYNYWSFIS